MAKGDYNFIDINTGDEILFSRTGIEDFQMYWKVIGFHEEMIHVEIDEMGNKDKLYIDTNRT
ncbi:hypothetical protein [Flavobacterium hercynium]|uniref:Uncharacterized protein n=1 Tax=Flavobacterium hercynium TaxID=387094 RepID=A0A226H1U2_9FLAO|nr:hypothetical protein [Flavobacterium hercynium]OXA87646.1 hypothetical protein B0A66_16045 [Flavobacterium hercynium]SMP11038.1 hypothetical protein SAMN06265346_10367 [Flavobacterium hercynium]